LKRKDIRVVRAHRNSTKYYYFLRNKSSWTLTKKKK